MIDRAGMLARVRRLQLRSDRLVESLLAGNYRSVFRGPGMEFNEVRAYVEGDDVRLIDWNVSSRLNGVFTKTFQEERELTLVLLVDMSRSVDHGASVRSRREVIAELFSLLAFAAVSNNDRVGAIFFTDRVEKWVPPQKGKKQVLRLISDMLTMRPAGNGSDLGLAIRAVGESLKRRGIVVLLSDFKTSGYFKDLTLISRRHDVIGVRVTDPMDIDYPPFGLVRLLDPETRKTMLATGSSARFRDAYAGFWEQHRRQWFHECRRRRVSPLEVRTDQDPGLQLIQFFNQRSRR